MKVAYSGLKPPKKKKKPDFLQEALAEVGLTKADLDRLDKELDKYLDEQEQ